MRPAIRGRRYAISARKPQAVQVGERILRDGGNAIDAAVAAAFVLAVTDPAMTGLGSDAFVLVYDARERRVVSLNGGGPAPALATIEWFREHSGGVIPANDGLLAASMPTFLDVCVAMLERWGTMRLEKLLAPAIELAYDGFPVSEYLADYFAYAASKLQKYPTTARLYKLPKPGDILSNPDLARTLERLAIEEHNGGFRAARDLFYRGEIARTMADFFEGNGGLYRYGDFAQYSVGIEEPVAVSYGACDVFKNASATQGPTELILLNLLETFDLTALGHNSADYIHISAEAAKLAYTDREHYLGDADFIDIPFARILSKEYAGERRALIDPKVAADPFPQFRAEPANACGHEGDTSYLAVVDEQGNAVSFTPSLHSAFGTGVVIADLGFIPNCRGDLYELEPRHPNSLAPGKRARSTLTPTMVLKDGRPFLVLGSPGGDDQPLRIAQTLLNILVFGMNVQEAIEAPRWSTSAFPASEFPHAMCPRHLALEDRIPDEVRAALATRGHHIEIKGSWTLGANCAIEVDPVTGVLSAGADPRGDSYALAW